MLPINNDLRRYNDLKAHLMRMTNSANDPAVSSNTAFAGDGEGTGWPESLGPKNRGPRRTPTRGGKAGTSRWSRGQKITTKTASTSNRNSVGPRPHKVPSCQAPGKATKTTLGIAPAPTLPYTEKVGKAAVKEKGEKAERARASPRVRTKAARAGAIVARHLAPTFPAA